MKKRNLFCSAVLSTTLSVMLAANAIPCSVYADEMTNASTNITEEANNTEVEPQTAKADKGSESTDAAISAKDNDADTNTANSADDVAPGDASADTSADPTADDSTADTTADDSASDTTADDSTAPSAADAGKDASATESNAETVGGKGTAADRTGDKNTDGSSSDSHTPKDAQSDENTEQTDRGSSSKVSTTSSVQTVERFNYDINVIFTQIRRALTGISITTETSAKNTNFVSKALAGITEQLKDGSEVDVVTGATLSSNAIIAALNEAGEYDSVSENLTASLNGTELSSSQGQQSGSEESGKGQSGSEESGKGQNGSEESGKGQETTKTVPANYITYTVTDGSDGHKVVIFQLSQDAQTDNTYVNMALLVDENGKHFMPVDAGSDETGNGNDYFAYTADDTSFTILNDTLNSIEVIFTSEEYGKVHFTVDLTAATGGNEEGSGAKEDDPKGNNDKDTEDSEGTETDKRETEDTGDSEGTETDKKDSEDIEKDDKETEETDINTDEKNNESDNKSETDKKAAGTTTNKTNSNGTASSSTVSNSTTTTVKTGDSLSRILIPSFALLAAMGVLVTVLRRFMRAM